MTEGRDHLQVGDLVKFRTWSYVTDEWVIDDSTILSIISIDDAPEYEFNDPVTGDLFNCQIVRAVGPDGVVEALPVYLIKV